MPAAVERMGEKMISMVHKEQAVWRQGSLLSKQAACSTRPGHSRPVLYHLSTMPAKQACGKEMDPGGRGPHSLQSRVLLYFLKTHGLTAPMESTRRPLRPPAHSLHRSCTTLQSTAVCGVAGRALVIQSCEEPESSPIS